MRFSKYEGLDSTIARRVAGSVFVAALGAGCSVRDTNDEAAPAAPQLGVTAQALTGPQCDALDIDRSLVVHDAATLNAADFSLNHTLSSIIASSGGAPTTPAQLLQSLIVDFTLPSATQPVSGLNMPVDVRPSEAALLAANMLNPAHPDFMRPVALFNRFDLMPSSAAHCGEYRIVYSKTNNAGGRFFLIFEAALPNPGVGVAGCQPVAEFWGTLSDDSLFPTPADRALALEGFYYSGLTGFDPVVTHTNYGVPFGQVRSNHFMAFNNWQLREWRTGFDGGGAATLLHDTVKEVALTEFYDSIFAPGVGSPLNLPPGLFASERAAFQADFLSTQIGPTLLSRPEAGGPPTSAAAVINGFGIAIPPRFNEFQSHAQNGSDVPISAAASGFLTTVNGAAPPGITGTRLLNRAGTQTCGGCHRFSAGTDVGLVAGNPVLWPSDLGFVHVDEFGNLSPALTQFFLPARFDILAEAVCDEPPPVDGGVPPVACGGVLGDTCSPYTQFCSVCLGGYEVGECEQRPDACPPPGYADEPVCGCDDVTYGSECLAHQAGVAVQHPGACDGGGGSCDIEPPKGCCFEDAECRSGHCVGELCERERAGVCVPPVSRGQCWEDSDCKRGQHCEGQIICPCGAACIRPDEPGRCVDDPDPCLPMDATGVKTPATQLDTAASAQPAPVPVDKCEQLLGVKWDGQTCVDVVGCSCAGTDCDRLLSSHKECLVAHEMCRPTITPIDVAPVVTISPMPVSTAPQSAGPATEATVTNTDTTQSAVEARATVKSALTHLKERIAESNDTRQVATKVTQLEAAVKAARIVEHAEGGAFVPRRRTH